MVSDQGMNYYEDCTISVFGLIMFQFVFWATSKHRSHIQWCIIIVGLLIQQAIALFMLKSSASIHMFIWPTTLASEFSSQAIVGATFFFDQNIVQNKHWAFINVVYHMH